MAKTKAELMKEARDLGIDVAGKTVAQLEATIKQASEGGDGHMPQAGEPEVQGKAKGATKCVVSDSNGPIRSFSVAEHGEDWQKNAQEFAGKVGGRSIEYS